MYIPVKVKLAISTLIAILWLAFSCWILLPWIGDLTIAFTAILKGATLIAEYVPIISKVIAWGVVLGIAILPGFCNAIFMSSLFMDKRPLFDIESQDLPDLTILIAAWNEDGHIYDTIEAIYKQEYPGKLRVIVGDDGSTDNTKTEAQRAHVDFKDRMQIQCVSMPKNGGKAKALNQILRYVRTEYFVTIDADTYLYKNALKHIASNMVQGPENTAAVAGTILARNSRNTFMSRLQEWDYFQAISMAKRIQSLYQGTLVAQGAFSIYNTKIIMETGGWRDCIGEDIVLTWAMREAGYRIGHSEKALAFTNVPETYKQFFRQRKRWSRGLIEALRSHPKTIFQMNTSTLFIWFNVTFPFVDLMVLIAFIPGIIAAIFFQWYAIVGIMTLTLVPLAMLVNLIVYFKHVRVFEEQGLRVRKNIFGFLFYALIYQLIMCPATITGYIAEIFNFKKTWGTK